jgi:hypothetical protein
MAKKLHGKQIRDNSISQAQLSLVTPVNVNEAATKGYVDNMLTGSTTGVTSLSTAISTEISVRGSADTSLSTIISTEISNRISGDTSLTTAITDLSAVEAVSRTIYISTTGSDITGDGSSGNTYASFLKAIQTIKPIINSGITITIDVAAGSYTVDMLEVDKYTRKLFLSRNAGITVTGKFTTDVSGLTITASSTPYVYNITGATFTTNQYQDYFMYNGTTFFPIVTNSATTINSVVGATTCTSIVHNTTIFNISNGNFFFNTSIGYDQNFFFYNIDLTSSVAIRFYNNIILDIQNSKITATQGSVSGSNNRNNFTSCAFVLSTSTFTPTCKRIQFRATSIRKSGTKTGTCLSFQAQDHLIPIIGATYGIYLYNWTTGIEFYQGNFEFNQSAGSIVIDNVTTALTIRNNSVVTFTSACSIYVNTVTTLLGVGAETLNGNYKFYLNTLVGTPTSLVAAGITSNGYSDLARNISVYIPGLSNNTIISNLSNINVSGATGFSGITYNDDISANFNLRSLVDKGFVTGYTSGITSSTTSLSTALSTEISTRSSADTSLSTAIASVTGVTSLSTALSNEISNRISGETSLSTTISTEISNRITGDTSLSTAISTEILIRGSVITSLSTAIIDSMTGITSLSTAISTETSNRTSVDSSLSTGISTETSNRTSVDSSLSTSISSETSNRTSGDISLSTSITNLNGVYLSVSGGTVYGNLTFNSAYTISNNADLTHKLYVDTLVAASGGTNITNYGNTRILTSDGTTKGITANSGVTFNGSTNTLAFNNSIVSLSGSTKLKFFTSSDNRSVQTLQSYSNFDDDDYNALLIGPFTSLYGLDTPRSTAHGDSIMMRAENTDSIGGWITIVGGGGNDGGSVAFVGGDGSNTGGTATISGGASDQFGGDLILNGGLTRTGASKAGDVKINSGQWTDSLAGSVYIENDQYGTVYIYTNIDSGAKVSIGDTMRYSVTGLTFSNNQDIVNKLYVDNLIGSSGGTIISNYGDNRMLTSDGTTKGIVAESNLTFDGSQMLLNGNLSVLGDLYVTGTTVTINTQNMQISDNLILINSGETASGVTLNIAGIEIERGYLPNYQFIFNETSDTFRVGEIGSLQAVATREDSPVSSGVTFWNNDTKQMYTSSNLTFVGSRLGINGSLSVTGNTYISGLPSSSQSNVLFYNTSTGQITYGSASTGSVTSVSAGNGMNFSTITSTGAVTLGTPSELNTGTTNSVSTTSHTHYFNSASYITGSDGILINGNGQFILDNSYLTNSTLANLYSYTGVTSNRDLGILVSGQTLGMVYIINTGTTTAEVNLGTTASGNEITPYKPITVLSGQTVSVTVNMRLSDTINTTIYISSASWTNVNLTVQWANITYKNASTTISPGDLPIASTVSLGAIKVGSGLSIDGGGFLSVSGLTTNLDSLTDVTITSPVSGQTLAYNGSQWINSGLSLTTNLDSLTDVTLTTPASGQTLVYNGTQWVNSGSTGGGGFLGNVTKNSSVPSLLDNNQWLRPEPQTDGTFNYTFDNFYDSGSLAINVNLSTEDVFLRYQKTGNYWIKESYNRPLTSGKTWIGSTNNVVQEISVIDEWVSSISGLTQIGQKFAYPTQTIFRTDLDVNTTLPNYIFIQNINLKSVGNTLILSIPSGMNCLLSSAKLIILNNASPTTFTVSIGNNSTTYNNIVAATAIDDVLIRETYELIIPVAGLPIMAVAGSSGASVYLRVSVASTFATDLYANLLVTGYLY